MQAMTLEDVGEEQLQKLAFDCSQNFINFDLLIFIKFMQGRHVGRRKSDNFYPHNATHFERWRLTKVIRSNMARDIEREFDLSCVKKIA